MKQKVYRHGEILLVKVKSIPKGLKVSDSKTLMVGSHGNSHTISEGKIYFKDEDQYIYGYLRAKNTKLFHPEHSPQGDKIEDGNYQLRRQVEFTLEGLVPIRD